MVQTSVCRFLEDPANRAIIIAISVWRKQLTDARTHTDRHGRNTAFFSRVKRGGTTQIFKLGRSASRFLRRMAAERPIFPYWSSKENWPQRPPPQSDRGDCGKYSFITPKKLAILFFFFIATKNSPPWYKTWISSFMSSLSSFFGHKFGPRSKCFHLWHKLAFHQTVLKGN